MVGLSKTLYNNFISSTDIFVETNGTIKGSIRSLQLQFSAPLLSLIILQRDVEIQRVVSKLASNEEYTILWWRKIKIHFLINRIQKNIGLYESLKSAFLCKMQMFRFESISTIANASTIYLVFSLHIRIFP